MSLAALFPRQWMLRSAPMAALAGAFWGGGAAAAAVLGWMGAGTAARLLFPEPRLYPGQRRGRADRSWFSAALSALLILCAEKAARRLLGAGLFSQRDVQGLVMAGAVCFSVTAGAAALSWPLTKKAAWMGGWAALAGGLLVGFLLPSI